MNDRIDLAAKLATFSEHWQPRVVAQYNGNDIMVAKLQGEFVWHKHDDTDDCFLVLQGKLTIQLRDREVQLGPGELFVVPRGVEHRPVAAEEVHILLIEPTGTPNTGDRSAAADDLAPAAGDRLKRREAAGPSGRRSAPQGATIDQPESIPASKPLANRIAVLR